MMLQMDMMEAQRPILPDIGARGGGGGMARSPAPTSRVAFRSALRAADLPVVLRNGCLDVRLKSRMQATAPSTFCVCSPMAVGNPELECGDKVLLRLQFGGGGESEYDYYRTSAALQAQHKS